MASFCACEGTCSILLDRLTTHGVAAICGLDTVSSLFRKELYFS